MIGLAFEEPDFEKEPQPYTENGAVGSYIHAGGKIGVLVELRCESDFAAKSDDLQSLIKDIAMQIAATAPIFIRKEDVTPSAYAREKEICRTQAMASGRPEAVIEKIVEGKMLKFYEEVCLLEQPFVKEPGITVGQFIANNSEKMGEKIFVRCFVRFKIGDAGETVAISRDKK